jgi:predicted Zn-dependent protease
MTLGRRLAFLSILVALLVGGIRTDAQDSGERDRRREQIRRSRAQLAEALKHIESGAYDSAAVKLDGILADDPGNADAHFHLGRTWLARADTTAAVSVLRQGAERAPLSTRMKLLLARLLIAGGSPTEAAAMLDGVLIIRPEDGETLYLRGLAHLAGGDSLAALETWRKSLEIEVEGKSP